MMTPVAETLIRAEDNPKGRTLAQYGKNMRVLSECCQDVLITDTSGAHGASRVHACSRCFEVLEKTDKSWASDWTFYGPTEPGGADGWADWGLFWFGLEGFALSYEEVDDES